MKRASFQVSFSEMLDCQDRHAREANSVLYDPKQFPVAPVLHVG